MIELEVSLKRAEENIKNLNMRSAEAFLEAEERIKKTEELKALHRRIEHVMQLIKECGCEMCISKE